MVKSVHACFLQSLVEADLGGLGSHGPVSGMWAHTPGLACGLFWAKYRSKIPGSDSRWSAILSHTCMSRRIPREDNQGYTVVRRRNMKQS